MALLNVYETMRREDEQVTNVQTWVQVEVPGFNICRIPSVPLELKHFVLKGIVLHSRRNHQQNPARNKNPRPDKTSCRALSG